MSDSEREYLQIPRDADFPTLPIPTDYQDYSLAYYFGAKELWETTGKRQPTGVPVPDTLVYPILFLVHHFLELELKSGIELTYSIGHMTGEITDEQDWRSHNLRKLLFLLKANLVLSQPTNNNYPNRLAEGRSKAIGPTLRFQTLPIPRLTEY